VRRRTVDAVELHRHLGDLAPDRALGRRAAHVRGAAAPVSGQCTAEPELAAADDEADLSDEGRWGPTPTPSSGVVVVGRSPLHNNDE
jgi:hypothetical protein